MNDLDIKEIRVNLGISQEKLAEMVGVTQPTEYIDTGDWFRNATTGISDNFGISLNSAITRF